MNSQKGLCVHRSIPVETDESTSISSSTLDLMWLDPCQQCSGGSPKNREMPPVSQWQRHGPHHHQEPEESCYDDCSLPVSQTGLMARDYAAGIWPQSCRERGLYRNNHSASPVAMESLEPPLPLISDFDNFHRVPPPPCLAPCIPGQGHHHMRECCSRQCPCQPPMNGAPRAHNDHLCNPHVYPPRQPQYHPAPCRPPINQNQLYMRDSPAHDVALPGRVVAGREVMGEVSVVTTYQTGPGAAAPTQEIRRTISLPAECRNIFITYSVDTAEEMIPFTKFLTDQGFNPSIDIFDNAIRRMDITKWMDSFLNDKSVLIIVVISPMYKLDVEGAGEDEHGLHTKYIHNQLQNEFIQQHCLNFRLVPVLFPSATKKHVPSWLQSTRLYRWPRDTQDLLLRLLREERYIAPQLGKDLTLTIRPVRSLYDDYE